MSTRPKKDRFWEKRAKAAKARIGELEAECKRLREGWAAQMSSPCPVCEGAYTDSVYLAELLVAVCAEERARTDDEYVRLSIGMAEAINHALGTFGDDYPGRLDPLREAVEAFEAFIVSDDAPCMKIGDAIEAMKQAAWDAERARRAAAMPTGGTDNG